MKKNNLIIGCLWTLFGVICLLMAIFIKTKLNGILWGLAGAGIAPGVGMIIQYFYWSSDKNRERYAKQLENKQIEVHDELKTKIRDKAGRYTFLLGMYVTCAAIMLFTVLNALEIIENSKLIVFYLVGFLMVQVFASITIFNHLLKKY